MIGCTPTQTSNFITILDTVATGIQLAIPVVAALVPGYGVLAAPVAVFLKLANVAADATAVELSSKDSGVIEFQKILSVWSLAVMDPAVLAKLPNTVGNVQVATLINLVVTDVNILLGRVAASIPGSTAVKMTNNAIITVDVPATQANLRIAVPHVSLPIGGTGKLKDIRYKTAQNAVALGR
jgi:hypothetical protein